MARSRQGFSSRDRQLATNSVVEFVRFYGIRRTARYLIGAEISMRDRRGAAGDGVSGAASGRSKRVADSRPVGRRARRRVSSDRIVSFPRRGDLAHPLCRRRWRRICGGGHRRPPRLLRVLRRRRLRPRPVEARPWPRCPTTASPRRGSTRPIAQDVAQPVPGTPDHPRAQRGRSALRDADLRRCLRRRRELPRHGDVACRTRTTNGRTNSRA